MKKKFFLCLIEIVSLTCMGHAAGLPVLPLPKVISTVDGANKGEKVYGDIDFIWRNTNPELYNCVQEEFKEFFRDSCPDRLKIIGEQSSSKKVLRAFAENILWMNITLTVLVRKAICFLNRTHVFMLSRRQPKDYCTVFNQQSNWYVAVMRRRLLWPIGRTIPKEYFLMI